VKLPRGVRIRENRQSESLQITFAFRGVTCREVLRLDPSAANIKFAANLLGEIKSKIAKGTFNYGEYFPDSKRAALFGHVASKLSLADLLDAYLAGCEKAAKLGNLSPSTLNGYRKIVKVLNGYPFYGSELLVDHYRPALRSNRTGPARLVRAPYASEVMTTKVIEILEVEELFPEGMFEVTKRQRVKVEKDGSYTIVAVKR
jgi:hypothetical protein